MLRPGATRLGIFLTGDRLVAASIRGQQAETFVVEAEQPGAALRAELDARRLRVKTAAIGLARGTATVKPIDLPSVGGAATEMVRFELERHLPFPADDAVFDVAPLPSLPGNGAAQASQRVLVAAVDRRVSETAVRIVQEARLRPTSMTVACHNLPVLVTTERAKRVTWVHRVGERTDLLFLQGPMLVLSRSLPAIGDEDLVEEIRRSLPVVRWTELDAVWVSGDAAAPEAPSSSGLARLGVQVTAPPYSARARRWLAAIEQEPRGALEIAVAVAAARRNRPLELLPTTLRPRRLTRGQVLTTAMLVASIAVAVVALLVPGYRSRQRLATINAQIARLDPEVRSVERVLQDLQRRRALLATIVTLESSTVRPLPVLKELTELIPNEAWLSTVSLDLKGVELTGQADAASALIPLLENSGRLEKVEFSSPVTRGRDREQFRIRAGWEQFRGQVAAAAPAPAPGARAAPPRRRAGAPAAAPPAPARAIAPQDRQEVDGVPAEGRGARPPRPRAASEANR
jgi:Tfp pilus assembly protein PilN